MTRRSILCGVAALATGIFVFLAGGTPVMSIVVGVFSGVSQLGALWFSSTADARGSFASNRPLPVVVWFTGLSGAGKSTIARWVSDELRRLGLPVEELDGDAIRDIFPNTGFTRPDRDAHIRRVGFLASKLEKNGVFVVAAFVSPYEDARQFVRRQCGNFVEVHVATPLAVCEQRDVKGLYAKARAGALAHFTGVDDPYEPPSKPDLVIDTSHVTVEEAGARTLAVVLQRGGASILESTNAADRRAIQRPMRAAAATGE